MKMDTPTYISEFAGCQYLPSIVSTDRALYFIDNKTKEIYRINNEGLNQLTKVKGFNLWANNNL
jgi:hypothetical protein